MTICVPVHPADRDGKVHEPLQVVIFNMVLYSYDLFIMLHSLHRQKIHYEYPRCKKGVIRLYIVYMVYNEGLVCQWGVDYHVDVTSYDSDWLASPKDRYRAIIKMSSEL